MTLAGIHPQSASTPALAEQVAAAIPERTSGVVRGDGWSIRRARPDEQWLPWDFGRRLQGGGATGSRVYQPRYGHFVFNAYSNRGTLIGSTEVRIGDRGSEHIARTEEAHGGFLQDPWFWPANPDLPWVLLGCGTYVKPAWRRKGVATALVEVTRAIGLPTYMVFANGVAETWFQRRYAPSSEPSWLQREIGTLGTSTGALDSARAQPDLSVALALTASRLAIEDLAEDWGTSAAEAEELLALDSWLVDPPRPDPWEIDGEVGVPAFADSGFARDRAYGYTITNWLASDTARMAWDDGWSDEQLAHARDRFDRVPASTSGRVDIEVLDPDVLRTYASVRKFLRTLEWDHFSEQEALWELFANDLVEAPRGLRSFAAVVRPHLEDDDV